ncbi:MAG TPA: DUF4398 domain-containing protein [Steroidobacteraceae bacterium]|nr:DUF4398 domain-containing protein [Steroidobacteraceae bacterium]
MPRSIALLIGLICLAGCQGAPVQEMSDARQAIEAARVAGAAQRAPADLEAAQAEIASAERHLQAQEYVRARDAALEAKRRAAIALSNSEHPSQAPP